MPESYVYFIGRTTDCLINTKLRDPKDRKWYIDYVKIGQAIDVKRRYYALQMCCPDKLVLIAYTERFTEKELHKKFRSIKHHGEWYHYTNDVIDFLKENLPDCLLGEYINGTSFNVVSELWDKKFKRFSSHTGSEIITKDPRRNNLGSFKSCDA